jgi:hypothetical protein
LCWTLALENITIKLEIEAFQKDLTFLEGEEASPVEVEACQEDYRT